MKLFLQPTDTFFFRDGRPFTKGEQSEGHSIFPPLPSTILGALRSAYIAEFGDLSRFYSGEMRETIGTPGSLCKAIRLRGVLLANDRGNRLEIFFPAALDLISRKDENRGNGAPPSLHRLVPRRSNFASNGMINYPLSWSTSESIESDADGLLDMGAVSRYLRGNDTTLLLTEGATLIEREPKIGIARSRETLSSEEQMLYRIEMSRFKNSDGSYGFVVDYECSESLPHRGLLKLGGEGKSFVYQNIVVDMSLLFNHLDAVKTAIQSTGRFKLYFATPAIFKHGWLPSWLSDYTLPGAYPPENAAPISLKLITAAVGKPVPVGGWDMAKGEAKPTLRAVPAGSVYYFELLDRDRIDDLINAFHYQNISDERADEGFGLALLGVAKEETS
ncbi:MAG: type III-B CRISPR module-associated protein Cmr3 [Caldilineaceae bacterium]|nr:type III-B CRISPR module-associated protein Cmr3 [Caldilineaceae bacterium]